MICSIIIVFILLILYSLKKQILYHQKTTQVINTQRHYHIPITFFNQSILNGILFVSSPQSQRLIVDKKVIPIDEIIHFTRNSNNEFRLHFNPPTKFLKQPIRFTAHEEDCDCVEFVLNRKIVISSYDEFNLFIQHFIQCIPSELSFVSSQVMLLNSIILSTKLPRLIDSLKIQSIDFSSLSLIINSLQHHIPKDYQSITSFEYQINIHLKSPIIFFIEGGILSPLSKKYHSFKVKYMVTFEGNIFLRMFHYPSTQLYFAFDHNIHMFNNFFLISNTHWVRKYAFSYIMNIMFVFLFYFVMRS